MSRHLTLDELNVGLPDILSSPTDDGEIQGIVIRPQSGQRRDVDRCDISQEYGIEGDHWSKGCWLSTEDGEPHPNVQICLMNARCIALIAQTRENWPIAGDNFFIDMDLTPANTPPGQRLAMGTAIIEVSDTPHNGCERFIERYGRDACVFVNTGEGKRLRLRGVYARVVQDGVVTTNDRVRKITG